MGSWSPDEELGAYNHKEAFYAFSNSFFYSSLSSSLATSSPPFVTTTVAASVILVGNLPQGQLLQPSLVEVFRMV